VITDHHADVYGLAVHRDRPFFYVSCSRDTTLRFWSDSSSVRMMVLDILINQNIGAYIGSASQAMSSPSAISRMCGERSCKLQQLLEGGTASPFERLRAIVLTFAAVDGVSEFIDCCKVLHLGKASGGGRVVHSEAVVGTLLATAQQDSDAGMRSKFSGIGGRTNEDLLLSAARIYASMGMMRKYCELMVHLGRFSEAIAVAPAVSIEYWRELTAQYGRKLSADGSDECVPLLIASGSVDAALDHLHRNDINMAFAVAKQLAANQFNFQSVQPSALPADPSASAEAAARSGQAWLTSVAKQQSDR
jgi:hypothetical protein